MEETYKEVYFGEYCKTCQYEKDGEDDVNSPCYDCLAEPMNVHSHKPVNYVRANSDDMSSRARRKEKE